MYKEFKAGNVLWIVASIITLLCTLGLLFFIFQEKNKRIEAEQKLSETERTKREVEIKLDHTQLELIQLKDQAKILESQLNEAKNNYIAVLSEVEKRDIQLKELENSLANEKKQSTSLANALAQVRENYDSLEEQLKEAKLKVENFKSQFSKSTPQPKVELQKIVVRPKKGLSGKVLVVNREFHFVVIDLGKRDGVDVGDEFLIYQAQEEIGKIKIEKLYDAMSTAAILPGSKEQNISEDNIVKSF